MRKTIIEENGKNGFDSYRVPGIVSTDNGRLLVCYEGRIAAGDKRTIFLRASDDGGFTFGKRMVMAEPEGGELLHNPLLIAGKEHTVWFFWCSNYSRLFMRKSDDGGGNFGPTRELTKAIEGFRKEWPVTLWAIAPGHGIVNSKGRLILPLWLSKGENAHLPAAFASIYSDDGGRNWKCSNTVSAGNNVGDPTEASIAERSDGLLLATMRHEIKGIRKRAFCLGNDARWGMPFLNYTLPDPICSGALLSLNEKGMAFVNCANEDIPALERQAEGENIRWSQDARKNLTLRCSKDDGMSWTKGILLEEEAGASDLAVDPDMKVIYCFHEQGWTGGNCIYNKTLILTVVSQKELLEKR